MEENGLISSSTRTPAETPHDAELDQLRDLILSRERGELDRIRKRLDDLEQRAVDVGRVLPAAVRLSLRNGDALAQELAAPVESALRLSVRRRPEILVSVMFPVIGPAIRRAVADAFARLAQSISQALDWSLSWRGLKWRLEAWRTGRAYAEIVLYHTLLFRVEQVLLICRPSGLLACQVGTQDAPLRDGDIVSSMLTAIHDFVVDSFHAEPGALQSLEIEDFTVWVESGPAASLAAVIRGRPPAKLRESMRNVLERVHSEFGQVLTTPEEMDDAGESLAPILQECLTGEFKAPPPRAVIPKFALALLAIAGVVWGLVAAVSAFRERQRWNDYLDRLRTEEGIMVSESRAGWRGFQLTGWRDPLAVDPTRLLDEFRIATNRVASRWEQYHAITPAMVQRRAERALSPPDSVRLEFSEGTLSASGSAPFGWVESTRVRALAVPGVVAFDARDVVEEKSGLETLSESIASFTLQFGETIQVLPDQEAGIDQLASDIKSLIAGADRANLRALVFLTGHTDRTGTSAHNLRLSYQRAEEARRLLEERGIPVERLVISGVGSAEPLRPEMPLSEEPRNRRVTFRATLTPGSMPFTP